MGLSLLLLGIGAAPGVLVEPEGTSGGCCLVAPNAQESSAVSSSPSAIEEFPKLMNGVSVPDFVLLGQQKSLSLL